MNSSMAIMFKSKTFNLLKKKKKGNAGVLLLE